MPEPVNDTSVIRGKTIDNQEPEPLWKKYGVNFTSNPWVNDSRLMEEVKKKELCSGMAESLYWGNLDVSNDCFLSAKFFGAALNGQLSASFDSEGHEKYNLTGDFLRTTVKNGTFPKESCTNEEMHHWTFMMGKGQPEGFKHQLHRTAEICTRDFCKFVQWEGNADLVGKGMVAAFGIEASIVTLFTLAGVVGFIHSYLNRRRNPQRATSDARSLKEKRQSIAAFESLPVEPGKEHKRGRKNFRAALRGTITGFWEGTVMFSVSLGIASLIMFYNDGGSYTLFFSCIVSVFASSCVYVLWPLIDGVTRRRKTYNLLLLATTIQQFILYGFFQWYVQKKLNPKIDHGDRAGKSVEKDALWEEHCLFLINPVTFIERIITTTIVFAAIVSFKMMTVDYLRPLLIERCPGRYAFLRAPWIDLHREKMNLAWKAFVGLCGFGMMWGAFARMIQGKQRLMNLAGGENLAGENEWGFGQVVALLTWAPYSLEFLSIWKNGYRKGLQKRLPKDVVVTFFDKITRRSSKDPDAFESRPQVSNRDTIYMDRIFNTDSYAYRGAKATDHHIEHVAVPGSEAETTNMFEHSSIMLSPTSYDQFERRPESPTGSEREFNMASPGDAKYRPVSPI
ncbi:hypothetical protein BJ508DRAFT_415316 [Ascobolus immersus RN42]|uniref:Uncharacterized protein n=1 Tax=Ascobolus immersus RN42 TaxID=1160509 RepID=A0A3N4I945_ASCIM|nr:hypothetical protein BJ508DRAFT_415316 [Ascobolus immersus RN42]